MRRFTLMMAATLMAAVSTSAARAQAVVASPAQSGLGSTPNFAAAKAFPLPELKAPPTQRTTTAPQAVSEPGRLLGAGAPGDGALKLTRIAPAQPALLGQAAGMAASPSFSVAPQEYGTLNHPFTTARVQLRPLGTTPAQLPTVFSFPYRAAGKLFFDISGSTYVCSAALIRRGLVVTAAHCVANFGARAFYTNFRFVPAYHNGLAPFGVWTAAPHGVFIMASYFNGTDVCAVSGIVCVNDVAVIRLQPQASPTFPGSSTGWYSVAFGSWGFTATGRTLVNQLGYPVGLDGGEQQERNDSEGSRDVTMANNLVIGSLMTGGSSGGPWLNNLGERPVLTGTTPGAASTPNVVIGVTSWGYVSTGPKEQGASPFTGSNIPALINAACGSPVNQPACQ